MKQYKVIQLQKKYKSYKMVEISFLTTKHHFLELELEEKLVFEIMHIFA
jgi:hypothetical protein